MEKQNADEKIARQRLSILKPWATRLKRAAGVRVGVSQMMQEASR